MSVQCEVTAKQAAHAPMSMFERYLTVWVFLCIVAGIALGQLLPGVFQAIGRMEVARVNLPVGLLIWVMIIPMLVKVDFGALHTIKQHVRGIGVTLFVNWLVKPFSMAFLGWLFMMPAAVLLLLFLTYPLGLGTWLGFTDARLGRPGVWVGLENYEFLWGDSVTRLALFNTLFYTTVASVLKFVLGLWLALLLNKNLPFKSFFRAVVLLPWIVPTALSAIAFWWLYDAQFSVFSWVLTKLGWIDRYVDFLGDPWNARLSTIAANVWRGVPFVAISLLAGLQTISPRTTKPRRSTAPRPGSSSAT